MREDPEPSHAERERRALLIALGALRLLLWEEPEQSGVNAAYRKLIAHSEKVIREEMLPRYSNLG